MSSKRSDLATDKLAAEAYNRWYAWTRWSATLVPAIAIFPILWLQADEWLLFTLGVATTVYSILALLVLPDIVGRVMAARALRSETANREPTSD